MSNSYQLYIAVRVDVKDGKVVAAEVDPSEAPWAHCGESAEVYDPNEADDHPTGDGWRYPLDEERELCEGAITDLLKDNRGVLALRVCRYLVADYNKGAACGGEMDWEDVDATRDVAASIVGGDWKHRAFAECPCGASIGEDRCPDCGGVPPDAVDGGMVQQAVRPVTENESGEECIGESVPWAPGEGASS